MGGSERDKVWSSDWVGGGTKENTERVDNTE